MSMMIPGRTSSKRSLLRPHNFLFKVLGWFDIHLTTKRLPKLHQSKIYAPYIPLITITQFAHHNENPHSRRVVGILCRPPHDWKILYT